MTRQEARRFVLHLVACDLHFSCNEMLNSRVGGDDLARCEEALEALIAELQRRGGKQDLTHNPDPLDFAARATPPEDA